MPAARKPKADGKIVALVPLSHYGQPIPADTDLRELLPAHIVGSLVAGGEAGPA